MLTIIVAIIVGRREYHRKENEKIEEEEIPQIMEEASSKIKILEKGHTRRYGSLGQYCTSSIDNLWVSTIKRKHDESIE